jgi:cystathionine beta-lyase
MTLTQHDFESVFDFETVIDRRSTDSIKWNMYAEDVLPLWVADMDFPAPEAVSRAIQERAAHGIFGYAFDSKPLRALIVERMARLYGWTITPDDILFFPGLVPALFLLGKAFGHPGESILTQTPVYPPFLMAPKAFEQTATAVPMLIQRDANGGNRIRYEIDFEALEAAISPQTRIFLLCNPHNPVGRAFTREELTRLAEIAAKHDLMICSDEIHCDLLLDPVQHVPIASLSPEVADRTVTLMAPSKTFNIAGLGCSFAIVQNEDLRKQLWSQAFGLLPFVNVFGFTSAVAAYSEGQPWLDALLVHLAGNRDFLCEYVEQHLPGITITKPEATYLAWLDCRALALPDGDPYKFFLEQAKVGLNDGKMFGEAGVGFVRLNFACPRATLTAALDRMRDALPNPPTV